MDEEIRKETYDSSCVALAALIDMLDTYKLCMKQIRVLEDGRIFFAENSAAGALFGKLARLTPHVFKLSQAIQLTLEPKQGDWVTDPVHTPDVHSLSMFY